MSSRYSRRRPWPTHNTEPGAGYVPIIGSWYGSDGIIFYKPGPAPEVLFN